MKYKLTERGNPQNPAAAGKLYATPVNDGKVSQNEIAAEIVGMSSLARLAQGYRKHYLREGVNYIR
ncbi:MAG: hypothetical protein LBB62_04845 [Proteiniphilum sp.]|jgi:hypothetical protein|nr:hypothetical protein [Proteiniphilum sp.]